MLDKAADQSQHLEPSHDTAYGLITIGLTYRTLRSHLPDAQGALLQRAFNALNEAARVAETLNDQRAASYAWGYLGALYEDERRYQDALQLTRRAIFAAQQVNAPESLYRWQWQTGRLLKALGQTGGSDHGVPWGGVLLASDPSRHVYQLWQHADVLSRVRRSGVL